METIRDWIERGRLGSEGGTSLSKEALVRFLQDEARDAPCGLEKSTLRLANMVECDEVDKALRLCDEIHVACHGVPACDKWEGWATWIGATQNHLIKKAKEGISSH